MRFSLKKKLKRVGAVALAGVMALGLMTSLPAGIFAPKEAKAEDAAAAGVVTKVWNFRGGEEGAYNLQLNGSTGEFEDLKIDATNGKLTARNSAQNIADGKYDTQVNSGTEITIPVTASSKWTLTVIARDGMVWTVGDAELTKSAETVENGWGYEYTISGETDADTTSIKLVAGANKYMKEIKLESKCLVETTTYNFRGGQEGAYNLQLNGKTGEWSGLAIDATSGKLTARDSAQNIADGKYDTQVNSGTEITIPVPAESEWTLEIIARDGMVWTVGDVEATKGEAAENGWGYLYTISGTTDANTNSIDLVAGANKYMKEIKLKVKRLVETTTYNFRGGQEGAYDLQLNGKTGEWNGLAIDATNGKLTARNSAQNIADGKYDTQVNSGTEITIPVPAMSEWTLEIIARDGMVWTVGDVEATKGEAAENGWGYLYTISGTTDDSTTSIVLVAGANKYMKEIKLKTKEVTYVEPVAPVVPGNGKADVVDFGGEELADSNNLFTVDVANGAHSGTAGATGQNVGDFTVKDKDGNPFVVFCAGGKTNNRLRTTNTAMSRWDNNKKTDKDGKVYSGFLYSNNASTDTVYLDITLTANDKLTMWVGSNGGEAVYNLKTPSGKIIEFDYKVTAGVEQVVIYAPETGTYRLWCTNEKLVVARMVREHSTPVKVTGATTYEDPKSLGVAAPKNYKLGFYCEETKATQEVALKADGTYTAYLYDGFNYKASLIDANGYVIATETAIAVKGVDGAATYNCTINPVDLVTVTGTITGIESADLAKMSMTFTADKIYIPEFTFDADKKTYTLVLEKGVEYAVTAIDVNDYTLKTTKVSATADGTSTIDFEAKPVYDVTITLEGIDASIAANATYTFTNIAETFSDKNATPYTYTFKATDKIQLRTGQYQVKVSGLNQIAVDQMYTKDVKVNDAPGSTTVKFKSLASGWDFSEVWTKVSNVQVIGDAGYVMGLKTSPTNVGANKTYLLMSYKNDVAGSFEIPVKKGDVVTLEYCYQAAFKVNDKVYTSASNSTGTFESVSIEATEDGVMTVVAVSTTDEATGTAVSQTYFTKIMIASVSDVIEYQEVVKVGANKQFTTINDALAFVRKMNRTDEQRVTVEIDPGTYDEMLVIDMPNVTLKNASATPSIELKNSGVDADKNAVRITSYYGHGYTYYSMGPDCKYDPWLLEVNQHNGYPLFENPGTGTTSGSYWNATVVVYANGFNADGIIFENAFNQYVSELAAKDTIIAQAGAKGEANGKRDDKKAGDTSVQNKAYVERAAALATANNVQKTYFNNCKFVGRQDTLYLGGTSAFNKCSIYGGTDYIFGPGTSVLNECDLVFNTMETNTDVGHITASQSTTDKGFLLNNCHVKSTFPGVDTASTSLSKPGTFGRPWAANTGMAVFVNTTVDSTIDLATGETVSLIQPAGWNSGLSGESVNSMEYNTIEVAGVDNSANRVKWATQLTEAKLPDGTAIDIHTWLGDWDPFDAVDDNNATADDEKDSADASVSTPDAEDKVELTDKEKEEVAAGADVKLSLEATDIAATISAEEKALVEALITGDLADFTIGTYLDIDLYKVIGGNKTAVTSTTSPLSVTIALPEKLISKTNERAYYVVRIHEGVATAIKADYNRDNQTITFATDKFSTYAILYKDGATLPEVPGDGNSNSGDATPVRGFAALAFGSVIVLAALVLFERKRRMVK